jgi:hypothetical protein
VAASRFEMCTPAGANSGPSPCLPFASLGWLFLTRWSGFPGLEHGAGRAMRSSFDYLDFYFSLAIFCSQS